MSDTTRPTDAQSTPARSGGDTEGAGGEDDTPYTCAHCERTFERERYLALHRGLRHEDLTEAEQSAFEEARKVERRELRRFRLKALAALVVLYFGLLMAYAAFG